MFVLYIKNEVAKNIKHAKQKGRFVKYCRIEIILPPVKIYYTIYKIKCK